MKGPDKPSKNAAVKASPPDPSRPIDRKSTISELADEYLRRHAREPYKRVSSVKNDRSMLRRIILPHLGPMRIGAITRSTIEDLRDSLSATKYTANRVLALLSCMYTLAEQWESERHPDRPPLRNPVRHVQRLEEQANDRWLRPDELRRLLRELNRHEDQLSASAVKLILLTGARKMECLRATWAEFDLDEALWGKPSHHVKQRKKQYVALNREAVELLRRMRREARGGPYLFPGRTGVRETKSDIYHFWDEVRQRAKLPDVRIHDLRHSFASALISAGESLEHIGALLGHCSLQATKRYSHLSLEPLREVSNHFGKIYREAGGRLRRRSSLRSALGGLPRHKQR